MFHKYSPREVNNVINLSYPPDVVVVIFIFPTDVPCNVRFVGTGYDVGVHRELATRPVAGGQEIVITLGCRICYQYESRAGAMYVLMFLDDVRGNLTLN